MTIMTHCVIWGGKNPVDWCLEGDLRAGLAEWVKRRLAYRKGSRLPPATSLSPTGLISVFCLFQCVALRVSSAQSTVHIAYLGVSLEGHNPWLCPTGRGDIEACPVRVSSKALLCG